MYIISVVYRPSCLHDQSMTDDDSYYLCFVRTSRLHAKLLVLRILDESHAIEATKGALKCRRRREACLIIHRPRALRRTRQVLTTITQPLRDTFFPSSCKYYAYEQPKRLVYLVPRIHNRDEHSLQRSYKSSTPYPPHVSVVESSRWDTYRRSEGT